MASVKILLNDVVSSPGAKFATADIVDFYLMTPLDRSEFVKIAASKIPVLDTIYIYILFYNIYYI